ncbi:MAG: ATP-binding protein [Planctomycetota bacterium]
MQPYTTSELEAKLADTESDLVDERCRHRAASFDAQGVAGAALADLDRTLFERTYLLAAFAPEVLAANERTFEQRLAATKMIVSVDVPVPTVAGLLTLGARPRDFVPGAYVQFLRLQGTQLSDPILDETLLDGPIVEVMRGLDGKLASHNRTAVDLTSGALEQCTSDYPLTALQQLVRNAVMHRTYERTNAPVRVVWFDDRIEIGNPGGPFGVVTAATFGAPGLVDYRNPVLAEVLKVLGYVRGAGVGIAMACVALAKNGNPPPEFVVQPDSVQCVMRRR